MFSQCPKCGKDDYDQDNLYTGHDGHQWCFAGHGLVKRADSKLIVKDLITKTNSIGDYTITGIDERIGDKGLAYLRKYRVTDEEIELHGFKFITNGSVSKSQWKCPLQLTNCLIFPVQDAVVLRKVDGFILPAKKAKAMTLGQARGWYYYNDNSDSTSLCITEDTLSGIACLRCGFDAFALLSNDANRRVKPFIINLIKFREYKNIYVLLDPDEAGIRGSNSLHKFLRMEVDTKIIKLDKDPKYYEPKLLRSIIDAYN